MMLPSIVSLTGNTNSVWATVQLPTVASVVSIPDDLEWYSVMLYYKKNSSPTPSSYDGYVEMTSGFSGTNWNMKRARTQVISLDPDSDYYFLLRCGCKEIKNGHSTTTYFEDGDSVHTSFLQSRFMLKIGDTQGHWVDFTNYIVAGSYKVFNTNVEETWEDANWVTHSEVGRKRIKGTFELLFRNKAMYNKFINIIQVNKEYEGREGSNVKMKLQINNELDDKSAVDIENQLPAISTSLFKVSFEPAWDVPLYGIKECDAVEVSIEEV